MRGWLHAVCFVLSVPAGAVVVASASSTRGRVGAVVYALGLTAVFGVSAAYHRGRWSERARW
jgi:hemolysin III